MDGNPDVFSFLPGCIHLVDHEICTQPGKKVNQKPYWVTETQPLGSAPLSSMTLIKNYKITTLDLTKVYWQIPLVAGPKEKTAFATPGGL